MLVLTPSCTQVDAGADLVVTQLFYDVDRFIQYEKDCRSVGISVPIIPGTACFIGTQSIVIICTLR